MTDASILVLDQQSKMLKKNCSPRCSSWALYNVNKVVSPQSFIVWNKYAIKRLQQCQFSENICTDHSVWLILLFYTILWKFIKSKVSLPIGDYCFAWTHVCLWLEEFYTMPFCHVMFLLFPFFLTFNDSCQWHTKMMVGGLKIWWNLDFIM